MQEPLTPFAIRPLPEAGPRGLVQFEGFAVHKHFIAESETVSLEVEVDDSGIAHCRAITVRGEDVSGTSLRHVPVARLLGDAFTLASAKFEPVEEGGEPVFRFVSTPIADRQSFYERIAPNTRRPRSGSPLTDENLRDVANTYRAAVERHEPPTKTIAETMHVARPTAARWVAKARERGFLGPSRRGQAGEGKV